MFRPYPPTRPPRDGLSAFRDPFATLRWIARPGPSLIAAALLGWTIVGLVAWLICLALSWHHHVIEFN